MKIAKPTLFACACLSALLSAAPLASRTKFDSPSATSARAIVKLGEPTVRLLDTASVLSLAGLLKAAKRHAHVATVEQLEQFRKLPGHKLVVHKGQNLLYLFKGGALKDVFKVSRSVFNRDKQRQGDRSTPEGVFSIEPPVRENKLGWTMWITINAGQRAKRDYVRQFGEAGKRAVEAFERKRGAISSDADVREFNRSSRLPGKLMWRGVGIHGGGNSVHWTHGCIAMDDTEALELHNTLTALPRRGRGTPMLIIP